MIAVDPHDIALVTIAAFGVINTWLTVRTHTIAMKTQADVATVEKATNSMKDALVKATAEASHAAGVEQGRATEEVRAAAIAEGKLAAAVKPPL